MTCLLLSHIQRRQFFADDTSILATGSHSIMDINTDLDNIRNWLLDNKLHLNIEKCQTLFHKIDNSTSQVISIGEEHVPESSFVKYLGIILDKKLTFVEHIRQVVKRVSKLGGILTRVRYFVSRQHLIRFYNSYIKPVIQYGILVYGCTSVNALKPLITAQKRIIRSINFRPPQTHTYSLYGRDNILTVCELHAYELVKFVMKSLGDKHRSSSLNAMFILNTGTRRITRRQKRGLLNVTLTRTKVGRCSVELRARHVFNVLCGSDLIPTNLVAYTDDQLNMILHKMKDNYIQGNSEFVESIYKL